MKGDKTMYTINDARREMKELFEEGYGWNAVRIFLNDLKRGKDITKEEHEQLMKELIESENFKGYTTL